MKTLTALILVLIPTVAFAAGGGYSPKNHPAKVVKIPGSELKTVILTKKAAERTGIVTSVVTEDRVSRKWLLSGTVMPAAPMRFVSKDGSTVAERVVATAQRGSAPLVGGVIVEVALSPSEFRGVAEDKPARIRTLRDAAKNPITAKRYGKLPVDTGQPWVNLQYTIAGTGARLAPGQRVSVEVPRRGGEKPQKIVPYSSVLYDVRGRTWVYTNPKPLTYVRHAITVDFIEGDRAVLNKGPSVGTKIVTVGAPELFGAETGIGK